MSNFSLPPLFTVLDNARFWEGASLYFFLLFLFPGLRPRTERKVALSLHSLFFPPPFPLLFAFFFTHKNVIKLFLIFGAFLSFSLSLLPSYLQSASQKARIDPSFPQDNRRRLSLSLAHAGRSAKIHRSLPPPLHLRPGVSDGFRDSPPPPSLSTGG